MNYLALAVLGYRIDHERLLQTQTRYHKEHDIPDNAHVKFCPTCGQPASWEEEVPIYELGDRNYQLGEFEIFFDHPREVAVISVLAVARSTGDRTAAPATNFLDASGARSFLEKRRCKLRGLLEKRGLLPHARYGLHAILTEG